MQSDKLLKNIRQRTTISPGGMIGLIAGMMVLGCVSSENTGSLDQRGQHGQLPVKANLAHPGGKGDVNGDGIVRVLPLGDSITELSCWRYDVYRNLVAEGIRHVDFVGSRFDYSYCGPAEWDREHEGQSGSEIGRSANVIERNLAHIPAPEIVLWHYGTNDVWKGRSLKSIMSGYQKVLNTLRQKNPRVAIIVAKILPVQPAGCTHCTALTGALNLEIEKWAKSNHRSGSPIQIVDFWTGWRVGRGSDDGVHPNTEWGRRYMTRQWYKALRPWLDKNSPGKLTPSMTLSQRIQVWWHWLKD